MSARYGKLETFVTAALVFGMACFAGLLAAAVANRAGPKPPTPVRVWPIAPHGMLWVLADSTVGLTIGRDTVLFENRHGDTLAVWDRGALARVYTEWVSNDVVIPWNVPSDSLVHNGEVGVHGVWNVDGTLAIGVVRYWPLHETE